MEIYTDGSCEPNPGNGGWAYVIPESGIEKFGGEPDTTNNRMEMQAIIEALRDTRGAVTILSDSQLCIYLLRGSWKAKRNRDQVATAKALMSGRKITFQWVRGHNGNRHNERADVLASKGRIAATKRTRREADSVLDTFDWRTF